MALHRMVCQSCGSTELDKVDGLFICRSCGTKHYLDEEFSKLCVREDGDTVPPKPVPQWQPPIGETPAETFPSEFELEKPSKGCFSCLAIIGLFFCLAVIGGVFFLRDTADSPKGSTGVSSSKKENLIGMTGVPTLYTPYSTVKEFYRGWSSDIVILNSGKFSNTTVLVFGFDQKHTLPVGEDNLEGVDDIQIYPQHLKEGGRLTPEQALQVAYNYMPWDIIEEYCEFDSEKNGKCYDYKGEGKRESNYVISYPLKEKYSGIYYKDKRKILGAHIHIKVDENQLVSLIHIKKGGQPWEPGRMSSGYTEQKWLPEGLHKMPEPPPMPDIRPFSAKNKKLRLLVSQKDLQEGALYFGEEKIYVKDKDNDTFGYARKSPLVYCLTLKRKKLPPYAFLISVNLDRFPKEQQLDFDGAIELCRSLLPWEVMEKHYELLFSRRKTRRKVVTASDSKKYRVYEMVYERIMTRKTHKEIEENEYPENIQVFIREDYDGNITGVTVSCYTYGVIRGENPYDDYGEMYEIDYWASPLAE